MIKTPLQNGDSSVRYPEREGRQLEFKRELARPEGILRTIVAFLNDIGGLIVIGIDDATREIRGLPEEEMDRYLERIPQAISDAIEPDPPAVVRTRTIGEATLLEVEVFPGSRRPYFIRSEGVPRGVYVRVGAHTKRAGDDQVQDLIRAGRGETYDSEPVARVTLDQLDRHLLSELYRQAVPDTATLRAERILAVDPVTKQDFVTVAGVVLLHPHPYEVFPAAEVLFTHFRGDSTEQIIRSLDISAPLPTVVYQLLNLIEPLIASGTERDGPKLKPNKFRLPPLAIREALLNALIHRRYTAAAPVKVALFDDRLEIFSPGNFPGPITLDELGSGVSYYRNPTIANLTRRLGLVERRGLGFAHMLDSCRANGNPPPEIREGGDFVKVTLYFQREGATHSLPADLSPLETLRQQNIPLTTALVREVLHVSAGTARARIQQLVDLGMLTERGKGRATRYEWKP